MQNFEEKGDFGANVGKKMEKIMRGELALKDYETALERDIKKMKTLAGLRRLQTYYKETSGIKPAKGHPLYALYLQRRGEIKAILSSKNTSENPRDSKMPSSRR